MAHEDGFVEMLHNLLAKHTNMNFTIREEKLYDVFFSSSLHIYKKNIYRLCTVLIKFEKVTMIRLRLYAIANDLYALCMHNFKSIMLQEMDFLGGYDELSLVSCGYWLFRGLLPYNNWEIDWF